MRKTKSSRHGWAGMIFAALALTGCLGLQPTTGPGSHGPESAEGSGEEKLDNGQAIEGDKHAQGMAYGGDGHGVSHDGKSVDAVEVGHAEPMSECEDGDPHSEPFPI